VTRTGRQLLEAEKRDWQQTAEIVARFFDLKAEDMA
jgi:PadR family transcriptional regulator PadR